MIRLKIKEKNMPDLLTPHYSKVIEVPNPMGHGGGKVRFILVKVAVYNKTQSPGKIHLALQGPKGSIKALTTITPVQAYELADTLIRAAQEVNQ